jgi:hypothetical protein
MKGIDALGWVATAAFGVSYLTRSPSALRRIQAAAAVLWIIYGVLIGALPVVVANAIVAGLAVLSSFRRPSASRASP